MKSKKPQPKPPAALALPKISAADAMMHPALFGPWFASASFAAQRTLVRAIFALSPEAGDQERFAALSQRQAWPTLAATEAWILAGRRSGKSLVSAFLAVYLAVFRGYDAILALGEEGTIVLAAKDKAQARTLMRWVKKMLAVPALRGLVVSQTAERISVRNGTRVINIEIMYGHFATLRSYTVVAAILDEFAYWPGLDSANPDVETLAAIRPAMATVPGALLVVISSPYTHEGELYRTWQEHFGPGHEHDPVLVIQAPTPALNPTIDQRIIARDYKRDPQRAASEWGGQFRDDTRAWLPYEVIRACVNTSRPLDRPPQPGVIYTNTWDQALGGRDESALCISHVEGDKVIIDCVRSWPGDRSRSQVHAEAARIIKTYTPRASTVDERPVVFGDCVAGDFVGEGFAKLGCRYVPLRKLTKSDAYVAAGEQIREGAVELPDEPRTVLQFAHLTLRWREGGRASVDDAKGNAEDRANVVALGIVLARRQHRVTYEMDEDGERRPLGSTDALQDRESRSRLELLKAQALAAGFSENVIARFLAGEDIFRCNGRHRSPGDGPVDKNAPCEGCQARAAHKEMKRITALEARARAQGFTEEEIARAKQAKDGEFKGLFRLERMHPIHTRAPQKPREPDVAGQIAALEDLLNPDRIHGEGGRLDRAGVEDFT